jgi:hypothetical protein
MTPRSERVSPSCRRFPPRGNRPYGVLRAIYFAEMEPLASHLRCVLRQSPFGPGAPSGGCSARRRRPIKGEGHIHETPFRHYRCPFAEHRRLACLAARHSGKATCSNRRHGADPWFRPAFGHDELEPDRSPLLALSPPPLAAPLPLASLALPALAPSLLMVKPIEAIRVPRPSRCAMSI